MSASREKKTRQDLSGSGWNDPKTAREAKQRQKEHSTNLLYGTIGVVFLVIAIAAVIWKSNIIPKTATAATVNGEKYTAAEVNFYFENYYQNFVNGNYSILSMIGLDTGTSLKDQTISSSAVMFVTDATEGETWYDYFADKALEQLAGVQAHECRCRGRGLHLERRDAGRPGRHHGVPCLRCQHVRLYGKAVSGSHLRQHHDPQHL